MTTTTLSMLVNFKHRALTTVQKCAVFLVAAMATSSVLANTLHAYKGVMYRISVEPAGIVLSIQNGAGQPISADPDKCGNTQTMLLSAKHNNYSSLKLAVIGAYHNQYHIDVQLAGCQFGLPNINKLTLTQ